MRYVAGCARYVAFSFSGALFFVRLLPILCLWFVAGAVFCWCRDCEVVGRFGGVRYTVAVSVPGGDLFERKTF